jgi:hypothetical protein
MKHKLVQLLFSLLDFLTTAFCIRVRNEKGDIEGYIVNSLRDKILFVPEEPLGEKDKSGK